MNIVINESNPGDAGIPCPKARAGPSAPAKRVPSPTASSFRNCLGCAVLQGTFPWRTRYPLSWVPIKPVPRPQGPSKGEVPRGVRGAPALAVAAPSGRSTLGDSAALPSGDGQDTGSARISQKKPLKKNIKSKEICLKEIGLDKLAMSRKRWAIDEAESFTGTVVCRVSRLLARLEVVEVRQNVLVMEFIGTEGDAAPRRSRLSIV